MSAPSAPPRRSPASTSNRSMPVATTGTRTLQLIRAGYGAVLVLAPGPAIRLATGREPSRLMRRTARLLGARHLVQTMLTAVAPVPGTYAVGGQVDSVHATSMLLLAAVSRSGRRAALTDALTEAAFAAAGFAASCVGLPV
jgi:hypothetical protein